MSMKKTPHKFNLTTKKTKVTNPKVNAKENAIALSTFFNEFLKKIQEKIQSGEKYY